MIQKKGIAQTPRELQYDWTKNGGQVTAHQAAIQREQKLRDQRPYLKENNPGSGPGDRVIIKR